MPRPHKTKNAAPNQRDTRHENGLAAPGKRISKKSSNGQLNGQPNGKPVSSAPPPALPTTGLNQGLRFPRPAESALETSPSLAIKEHAGGLEITPRNRTASEVSLDEVGLDLVDNANEAASAAAPCVEAQVPATIRRTSLSQAGGPLSTMSTILTYYPLRDAISILILLLSLPPTLVLVIQSLFASLTFVPPTAGISLSTFPNIKEMFNASNLGYPALATILIVDFIFWAFWLPMWKPLQSIFLDFSQAVIAVSLSGAAASTGGPTYSIATTTLTVCLVHVLRYKAIHLTALDYLRSVIHNMDIGIQLDVPPIVSSFLSPPIVERGWGFTVIRTILGIHIVSQGVTTCIRRSLVKANERDQTIPTITTNDSDVALNSEPNSRPPMGNVEAAQQPQTVTSSDGRPPGPPPLLRDGRPRESSTKRKKKQANQVRSQQPLWAAIASTKVTFVKEMEQRDAADDAREAAEMDRNTKPTFTSTIISPTDRICITEVRDTEVYFSVQLAANADEQTAAHGDEEVAITAGIDKSKPFFIRINGAAWSSARIMSSATGDEANGKPCYDGEIFGLAPRSTFLCEVVDISSGAVLCSLRFITDAAPSAEQVTSVAAQPRDHHPRPASPSTTLRQSILTASAKLNDARNKAKKIRREQKAAITDLRKDINNLKKKLKESSEEDRQKQKMQQFTQHRTKAEEDIAEFKRELESFGDIPDNEIAEMNEKRQHWAAASNTKRSVEETFNTSKAEADRELTAIRSEMEATKTKRERMEARHAQRVQEHEKLESKQQADMSAKQRRELERARVADSRRQEDWQFRSQISGMESEINGLMDQSQETYQQLAALQSWNTAPPAYPGYSSPPTPEGMLPGTNGSLGSPHTNGFASHGPQPFQSPFHSAQPSMSNNTHGPRGRSSSMLSQYSGFTDNGEEYAFAAEQPVNQYSWPMQPSASAGAPMFDDRKESEGSGSLTTGSTGSNSPRPDANPFIPAGNKAGTIGPPGKSRDKVAPRSPQGAIGSGR
ncbi:hypothetical protein LTR78_008685 [Recurvomyces mirabilis]|uniref:Ubiquitination network signaling protein n=1 Tax=Recurvomyces mirabilis TaxID=574656 RepID=A0AAE0TUF5_9PEZI|nr:hypothetical protein LTR78_008685 [Recurvomyces mirabilis]KAK5159230.1 hypothetical protein LTS14_002372 [Recurvomyces mirabilis]